MLEDNDSDFDGLQREVTHVLAIQYTSPHTGLSLGFPAFNQDKDIIGFYRESHSKVGVGRFVPLSRLEIDFSSTDRQKVSRCLIGALENRSPAVYSIHDWGSINHLVDHAMVYDWSQSMVTGGGGHKQQKERGENYG